jgi:hypothetical protein
MKKYDKVQGDGPFEKFSTGAVRDQQKGKGRFDLIPFSALERLAVHYENGSARYGDSNWKKGIPLRTYLNSAARHLWKLMEGWEDEDHAAAGIWNLACFIETLRMIEAKELPQELDNRRPSMEPPKETT